MAQVRIKGVKKHFGEVRALDGIDLDVHDGEFLVLLGPSGSGKSTLMRIIAGLEKVTAGEIDIGDLMVNALPPRARNIAMVFQSYALYPHMKVFDNIAFPLKTQKVPKNEIAQRVKKTAEMFDITRLMDRKPRQLSGGERQRVALARAIVRDPVVFLMDEPLSNLDAKLRATARDELKSFQRRVGITTVFVTHDQIEAMGMGDRIAVMNFGILQQVGTPQEVYGDPANTFVATFLGTPPMNLVERANSTIGFRPEHFRPKETFRDQSDLTDVPFRVTRVEFLGSEQIVYGVIDGMTDDRRIMSILAATEQVTVQEGVMQEFAVKTDDFKYFDNKSGNRIAKTADTLS